MHFYSEQNLRCNVIMEGTSSERLTVDIKASVEKHANIVPQLLAAHGLSGCDTVAQLYGIGKGTVVKKTQSWARFIPFGKH